MTEKRFKEVFPNIIESSCSFTDNGKGITHKEVVGLLNALHEENMELKKVLFERNVAEQRRREYNEFWNEKIKNMV